MTIDKNKKYKTRGGSEVMIHTTDREGDYSVCGAIKSGDHWEDEVWTDEGIYIIGDTSILDLVEVVEKPSYATESVEISIEEAIQVLKNAGYKVLKPVNKFVEI